MNLKISYEKIFQKIIIAVEKYWYFAVICLIFNIGIVCRIEALLLREFWLDEIALAANFVENNEILWVFRPLQYYQIAPPLFLFFTKIYTAIFGIKELAFRLFPFTTGIASIFIFYKLSKTILKTKAAIILANFLFAINFLLIRYTSEFKQYGTDVLIFMSILIWLSRKPDFTPESLNIKTFLKYSIIFTILFFISQPVVFLLFGFVLYNILIFIKQRGLNSTSIVGILKIASVSFIPLLFVLIYKFSIPKDLAYFMHNYWEIEIPGFIAFYNIKEFLQANYEFFTLGSKYMIILIPFALAGFFIFLTSKTKISKIFSLSLLGAILAIILHLYPFVARMILFLLPFALIFIALCFDFNILDKKIKIIFSSGLISLVVLALILFQAKIFCKNRIDILRGTSGNKEVMLILKNNFSKESDIILLPKPSVPSFKYYSTVFDFNADYIDKRYDSSDSLKNKEFAWIYISYNTGENMKKFNMELLKLMNNNDIYYTISLSKWAKLFKIRLKKQY